MGVKANQVVASGAYQNTLVLTTTPGYIAEPTITNVYNKDTTTNATGPTTGGTEIDIHGTNLDTAYQVFIDLNNNGQQDSGEQCSSVDIVSATKITCNTPAGVAGQKDLIIKTWGGSVARAKGFDYIGQETWGFTVDTSYSDSIAFNATADVPLEIDFGDGVWVDFATGSALSGIVIPSAEDAPLSHVRVRPQDPNSYNWFPIGTGIYISNSVFSSAGNLRTLDYPITTRSISDESGRIVKSLSCAFYYAYYLTTPVSFVNSDGVNISGDIGDNFLSGIHGSNYYLEAPIDLAALAEWDIVSIGDRFLSSAHYGGAISALTTAIDLSPLASWNITGEIGEAFLSSTHEANTLLTEPIDLSPLKNWGVSGALGWQFLSSTHKGNSSLIAPIDLSPLASWNITSIGHNLLVSTHQDNTSLVRPIDLSPLAEWDISGAIMNNFLSSTHAGNSSLTTPIDLTPLSGWNITSIGNAFLHATHLNNEGLLNISSFRLPNWAKDKIVNSGNALYLTFCLSSATTTSGGEPRFMDGTYISSVGSPVATPTNRQTYENRSSITPANSGWK